MNKGFWAYTLATLAGATALTLASTADAAVINIVSNAGDTTRQDGGINGDAAAYDGTFTAVGGGAVAVTPHPNWQNQALTNPTATWISYALTGISPDNVVAPFKAGCTVGTGVGCSPLMIVEETIDFGSLTGSINLKAWADDTIDVYLDGNKVVFANFTQNVCADGAPGCEPNEFATIVDNLGPGQHTLRFEVYQIGTGTTNDSNPFGLLYSGTATTVPEPVTLSLLGAGLLGLGFAARRRRR